MHSHKQIIHTIYICMITSYKMIVIRTNCKDNRLVIFLRFCWFLLWIGQNILGPSVTKRNKFVPFFKGQIKRVEWVKFSLSTSTCIELFGLWRINFTYSGVLNSCRPMLIYKSDCFWNYIDEKIKKWRQCLDWCKNTLKSWCEN